MTKETSSPKKKSSKSDDVASSLESPDASIPKPRLKRLIISNFRSITKPVSIDLDEIVVLVGPNNSGKSSILRAYEVAMCQGSKDGDFHYRIFRMN